MRRIGFWLYGRAAARLCVPKRYNDHFGLLAESFICWSSCHFHVHSEFEGRTSAEWRDDHIQERVGCSRDSPAQRRDGLAHDFFVSSGIYAIAASYPGDADFAASTSPGLRQVVKSTTKSVTQTTLVSSLNPSVYGQKVTWTASVTTSGSVPPTGKVNFTWGYNIGTVSLDANGVAALTRSNLNADSYPLKAVYVGDASNLGSTSAVVNQLITQATTSATLTSSPNPSSSGQAVTFTATIISPTVMPTGPVTFAVGKTVLGTAQLSGGKAKFTITTLAVGSTKVTATYYGNSNIAKTSASVTQTVH